MSTQTDLCPIEGRRSYNELWMKLIFAHITTVTAYCHLLHLRGENMVPFKILYFILNPCIFVVQNALSIFIILWCMAWNLLRPLEYPRLEVGVVAGWLYGSVPQRHEYQRIGENGGHKTKWTIQIGRVVVVCCFLFQCSFSILLYRRRRDRHAESDSDGRVFQLSLVGLIVGVLTLLQIAAFGFGFFARSWSEYEDKTLGPEDPVTTSAHSSIRVACMGLRNPQICLRYNLRDQHGAFGAIKCHIGAWLRQEILSCWSRIELVQWIRQFSAPGFWPLWIYWLLPSIAIFVRMSDRGSKEVASNGIWKSLCGPFWLLYLIAMIISIGGWIVALTCWINDYFMVLNWMDIAKQNKQLKSWPVDKPCPMLWSDSWGNWL